MVDPFLIDEQISSNSTISEALEAMQEYKCWSESAITSYRKDVMHFEEFLCEINMNCSLLNGKIHLIQKWIEKQHEEDVAYSTIKRRIAPLSSIFSFYHDLGVIQNNCFKAIEIPPGHQEHHSPILEINQLKHAYQYANELEEDEAHIRPTIKLLILSGLRNHALTNLKVKDLHIEKSLLCLNEYAETINTKKKVLYRDNKVLD